MSLASDFGMYYRSTYIGYRTSSGRVIPFYVSEVSGGDGSHSEESQQDLVFHGVCIYDDRSTERNVRLGDGLLVLELPELGYIQVNGRHLWITYRPIHQASKGLSGRRVVGTGIGNNTAKAIYKALHDQPDNLARQFHKTDTTMSYKGRQIGTIEGTTLTLLKVGEYLVPYVGKVFPELTVQVQE